MAHWAIFANAALNAPLELYPNGFHLSAHLVECEWGAAGSVLVVHSHSHSVAKQALRKHEAYSRPRQRGWVSLKLAGHAPEPTGIFRRITPLHILFRIRYFTNRGRANLIVAGS